MNNKGASFSTSSLSSSNSLTIAASVTGAATAAAAAVTQPSTNLNEPIKFLYGHKGPIIRCLSYDGYFVTAGYDQQIIIWDDESAKQKIAITSAHDHIISGLDIHYASGSSYKDAYIVSSSWDKTCKVFHLKDGKLIACFRHHQNRVKCVRAVVDREKVISKVVSGDDDGKIYLWTLLKAEKIYCLEGHSRLIVDLTSYHVSSTETYLASCSLDATIRFWDLLSGELKHVSETTAFKCLNSLLSTSMLPCDQTASVSTLHHNHNVSLGDSSSSSSIGPMHSQYSMGNHHNIFSLPALVPPPPIISNNSSSQVMDSASAVCSRIQTMKSPPKLIDTILIAAATAAAADSKDKDTSGSVLIFRSSGPLIGSLLYRVNTSAKVVCLFLTQELDVPYFNQPSSAGSSHYPSSSSVVVAATASGIPSRINTAKGPPVPPTTSQPDHPHLIYILEDAIMGYIDLRTISSLCSSITVDADSIADRGVTTSIKRPQIATTVTHRTTLYLYHDLDGNAVDASSDHHHHTSNGNDNEDMKIMGSMSNAAIERGIGSITAGSLHHKSSGGNLLRSNSSKIVVHPIKETSSLSTLMMVNDDDDSNDDDDDDGHDSDDDSSIRRRDDASSQALVQEALHQDRVNALDISCCTVSKTLFVRTKMISTNNCYMYILIGRRDGSLRRKIFHSTRRPSRHDIYLMSPDAVTTDLNIVDTMQRSDATTITSNRKGSLNNTNRSSITMKDRDKKVVSIPSNNDKGGMKNSHSKATDIKTIIDSVGNNNQVMQHSMLRSNSENVSTLYHNSNSNNNHQLKKKSHSHPGHLLYKATDVDLDDNDVDEAMYDPVQKTYVYKSPPSINNDIASSSQQQLPPNDDMRGVVLLSEFDFAKSNDELLSMTSDYEMNANIITDLQSQQSNSSIWSPRVVDQVKASLRRINLHSSHSKDRLHLRPLVYRREKTPSRATVMQVNSMNNRNRDSKDRKAMIRPKRSNLEPIDIRGRRVNTADKLHSSSIIRNQVSISTFRVDFHTETD